MMEMDPVLTQLETSRLALDSGEAVRAAATAYTGDGSLDVARRLADELAARGHPSVTATWLERVAHLVRSGHGVDVEHPDGPGLPPTPGT